MRADSTRVAWLLEDLSTRLGFTAAVRDIEAFVMLVAEGPEGFADAVLVAEGLDPEFEKRLRRQVRDFVAQRFERWSQQDDLNTRANSSAKNNDPV